MKKKILAMILACAMILALAACSGSANTKQPAAENTASDAAEAPTASEETEGKTYTVGVCQLVQHEALDAATQGFCDALTEALGDAVTIDVQNASGDSVNCGTIVNGFVSKNVDLIMANATPALTAAAFPPRRTSPSSARPSPPTAWRWTSRTLAARSAATSPARPIWLT